MSPSQQAKPLLRYRIDDNAAPDDIAAPIVMGWRETVALPDFRIDRMEAKLDSGAVVSALHAIDIERFSRKGEPWLRFTSWVDESPSEAKRSHSIRCEAKWLQDRVIRSSNGQLQNRPTIETILLIGGFQWRIEVTLSDRSDLECKLLLGRSALAHRCWIDCSRCHLTSNPQ